AQGLIAGINAARRVQGRSPLVLGRDQAYIGVLIDDLVTKGTTEPYRMFTSRAEYRLLLRQDNADLRLSGLGREVGLLPEAHHVRVVEKEASIRDELARISTTRWGQDTLEELLRRPEVAYRDLQGAPTDLSDEVIEQVEFSVKYAGYIQRQVAEVERFRTMEEREIPEGFDFGRVPGLRNEARQKLGQIRPRTFGQASRISGVSPADLSLVLVWAKRGLGEST
ncbi:MAG: tRNA uridine-5-carboxymethylaminomethyl(34) synthesis enzyme MnmG, partial [Verrucomicrobiota bacterium]